MESRGEKKVIMRWLNNDILADILNSILANVLILNNILPNVLILQHILVEGFMLCVSSQIALIIYSLHNVKYYNKMVICFNMIYFSGHE